MDWEYFLQSLGIEGNPRWQGSRIRRVKVNRREKTWHIELLTAGVVPSSELRSVEKAIADRAGLQQKVMLVPYPIEPEKAIKAILETRRDELSSSLFSSSTTAQLLEQVEWRVEKNSLNLIASRHEEWEEILATDTCSRLAGWFQSEYGLSVLVKSSCIEPVSFGNSRGVMAALPDSEIRSRLVAPIKVPKNSPARKKERKAKDNLVTGTPIPMREVEEGMRNAVVEGEVINLQQRRLKEERQLITYYITDYTDTLMAKYFCASTETGLLEMGDWVRVQGAIRYDDFEKETVLFIRAWEKAEPSRRQDNAVQKRVELHVHTVMSALDGVVKIRELVDRASSWGHPAVAITDHGVVQAFPEAYAAARQRGLKLIYGVEAYLVDEVKQKHAYHIIILARNQEGLRNLYHLVSISHLDSFYRTPRIRREDLVRLRSGLILGTACEAGELITAYLENRSEDELIRIASFYDFLEIQPLKNNEFLVREGRLPSMRELEKMNSYIVELGETIQRPVVATGDVHFLDPHHEVYRRILQTSRGYEDAEAQAPLYFRTTEEMLAEFAYLGSERAYQVVVENSRLIADRIESLQPVPDGNYFPTIEGAGEDINHLAQTNARRIYGDVLPPLVEERLNRELDSIIKNNYSVLYLIAHKLVKKSNEDGYLVGSRGSVGSSFVAYLTGITEVNPLVAHYRCSECYYTEFIGDGSAGCGVDLPERDCPGCGRLLIRDGFDIPFETFLGFEGDKVPDIDLNFSGEYQAQAHQYVEKVFGREYVFRAGTINTLAEASGIGMVKNYSEVAQVQLRKGEVLRLAGGITGVKKTSGQHPGGLIVVPNSNDIHEFTPLNHPANKMDSETVTTHFDYHSISERLVKLDILGHDDPTVIKMLEDMTGHPARSIALNEAKTMQLFAGVESLGVSPEDIRSSVGTFGIPEFGTRFVRQMLEVTRPRTFSELVRISGLSHGTNVWLNNAQNLIESHTATLNQVIATRDDIMTFLIRQGLDKKQAFKIMENVRKGKGLTSEEMKIMEASAVPSWYTESCQRIKYMFPKAHAVAYVMMAFRIAYFKVYYPREFYAAFFSVRAEDFDAEVILGGYDDIRARIEEIEKMGNGASQKDKKLLPVFEVALEMNARGHRFLPVMLYHSEATRFLVHSEGLVLPFSALPAVGDKAAESIVAARTEGRFASIEALQRRAGISRTVIDILKKSGCLDSLPETSQLSLFA